MKHHHVLLGIFSFIFLGSLLAAAQATQIRTALAMESLRHANLAEAMRKENQGVVLGVSQGDPVTGSFEIIAGKTAAVLSILQEGHVVVVEYTESGALVQAIDGVGIEDEMRRSGKNWHYTVNGIEGTILPDRYVVHAGDRILWSYQ